MRVLRRGDAFAAIGDAEALAFACISSTLFPGLTDCAARLLIVQTGMNENTTPTVEMSLEALSDAVGKASDDLRAVRATLDVARADIVSRNTSLSRDVVGHAEQVIVHLREADESLRDVLKDLSRRD
jgi:hypothetical protein